MGKKSAPGFNILGIGGVVNTCTSDDKGYFCQLSRLTAVISMFFTYAVFAYIIYTFLDIYNIKPLKWFGKKRKK